MVESHNDELTRLDVDRDSDSVLVGGDTEIDVFVDGDGTVIEEVVAEDGYLTLTGTDSDAQVTLQFRLQQDSEDTRTSVETEPVDPIPRYLVENGYPIEELNDALDLAQERFGWALEDHVSGDNWSEGNPANFADAVDRNIMRAVELARDEQYWESRVELGDALNYLLFMWAIVDRMESLEDAE